MGPQKTRKILFWPNLPILAVLGTFWNFFFLLFFDLTAPKKNKKITFLAKFTHFSSFGHFLEVFFFFYQTGHKKTKKITFLAKFTHFVSFKHFLEVFFFFFFLPNRPPKNKKLLFLAKFTHFGSFKLFLEVF